jgi:hypothetical protein
MSDDSDALGRFFDEMMPQALKFFDDVTAMPQHETVRPLGEPLGFLVPPGNDLTVTKLSAVIQVPDELLMDAGIIPDTRPPRPPLPWRWRMRNRIGGWREIIARWAFKIIAGYEVPDCEE